MISRENNVWAIGYDGNSALVDRTALKRYGTLSTAQLLEAGFFRAAATSALYSGLDSELALVAAEYNRISGSAYTADAIPRLFGVAKVTVSRSTAL